MTDIKRSVQDSDGIEKNPGADDQSDRARTEGTNRDFDASGTSTNQGHGHPREERASTGDQAASNKSENAGGSES